MAGSNLSSYAGSAGALACAALITLSGSALAQPPSGVDVFGDDPPGEDFLDATDEEAAEGEAAGVPEPDTAAVPAPEPEPAAAPPAPCRPAKCEPRPAAKHEPPPEYAAPPALDPGEPPPGYGALPPPGYGTIGGGDQIRTERFSTGLMVTGIIFLPIGALALGAGGWLVFQDEIRQRDQYYDYEYEQEHWGPEDPERAQQLGLGLMIGGGAALVSGIIMTAVGARKVPVIEGQQASATPTVAVTANGGSLTWSF